MNFIAKNKKFQKFFPKWSAQIKWKSALEEGSHAACEGYKIARDNLKRVKEDIDKVSEELKQHLASQDSENIETTDIKRQTQEQLQQVVLDFYPLNEKSQILLEEKRKRQDKFSIALFGRTMTGKSTLMEILTKGDGVSIGKGGQRTTQDIRSYDWKGLDIIDVPGVAAFEGREDEEKAFEAAAQSDLVLFLITDDAPQDEEAKCLARVRSLGKPILGICNVKIALNNEDDMLLFLRRNWFDQKRSDLDAIVRQFHEFVKKYNPGSPIHFAFTHLQSKFLSQRPKYKSQRSKLERTIIIAYLADKVQK